MAHFLKNVHLQCHLLQPEMFYIIDSRVEKKKWAVKVLGIVRKTSKSPVEVSETPSGEAISLLSLSSNQQVIETFQYLYR